MKDSHQRVLHIFPKPFLHENELCSINKIFKIIIQSLLHKGIY